MALVLYWFILLAFLFSFLFSYLNATSYDSFLYERDNISLVTDIFLSLHSLTIYD